MHTLTFPSIPVPVSRIALGTAMFGTGIPHDDAWRVMDCFVERGGTCLDTAHIYAAWLPGGSGASETTIGAWIRSRNCRHTVVLMTKGGHYTENTKPLGRLRPEELAADLEQSLDRLGLPCVDIYWLHRDNPDIPVGEVLDALEGFRRSGRIRAAGCSNWRVHRLSEAREWASRHGIEGFVASQVWWTLAHINREAVHDPSLVTMDGDAFAFHRMTQVPVFAYSPQAGGYFRRSSKPHIAGTYDNPISRARRTTAERIAERLGGGATRVALAWLLHQPFPVVPIIGCSTRAQLEDSLAADDLRLAPEDVAALSA